MADGDGAEEAEDGGQRGARGRTAGVNRILRSFCEPRIITARRGLCGQWAAVLLVAQERGRARPTRGGWGDRLIT